MKQLWKLCQRHDIVFIQETHTTPGAAAAWQHPRDFRPYYSHGDAANAGVIILIREDVLKDFNPITKNCVVEIEQGRALQISLHHPTMGNLRLINLYLHTGEDGKKDRHMTYNKIVEKATYSDKYHTIMAGDFNLSKKKIDLTSRRWSSREARTAKKPSHSTVPSLNH